MRRYVEETGFPFDILVDEERDVARSYGVWHRVGLAAWNIARPSIFLIDPDRSIRHIFVSHRQSEYPSQEEILAVIDEKTRGAVR